MSMQRLGALICLLALLPVGCSQLPLPDVGQDQGEAAEDPSDTAGEVSEENEAQPADAEDEEAVAVEEPGEEEDAPTAADGAGPSMASRSGAGGGSADMLSEDELAMAEALALDSQALGAVVAAAVNRDEGDESSGLTAMSELAERPSYRVLYTQRHVDKYAEDRKAEVAVYRYDTGEVSLSTVDLESGEVEALDLPEGFPAPLVPEEIEEAARVAKADDAVRARLAADGLDPDEAVANGIITVAQEEGARCAQSRCVRLFFSSFREPMPRSSVIVDLNTLEVVEIEDMPGMQDRGEGE